VLSYHQKNCGVSFFFILNWYNLIQNRIAIDVYWVVKMVLCSVSIETCTRESLAPSRTFTYEQTLLFCSCDLCCVELSSNCIKPNFEDDNNWPILGSHKWHVLDVHMFPESGWDHTSASLLVLKRFLNIKTHSHHSSIFLTHFQYFSFEQHYWKHINMGNKFSDPIDRLKCNDPTLKSLYLACKWIYMNNQHTHNTHKHTFPSL
jgi:hypothetical protein